MRGIIGALMFVVLYSVIGWAIYCLIKDSREEAEKTMKRKRKRKHNKEKK